MIAAAGHNLPTAREWLYAVLHSGEVTRVGQHLALVIFHIVDENGHASASVRDLERITGWGRQTIADHLGELKVFMAVTLGVGRGKSEFDLQCKITRAVNELRCVRQLDTNGMRDARSNVQQPDASVHQVDKTTVREMDATPDTNASVREMDAKTVASGKMASQPDTNEAASRTHTRAQKESLRDSYSSESVSETRTRAKADDGVPYMNGVGFVISAKHDLVIPVEVVDEWRQKFPDIVDLEAQMGLLASVILSKGRMHPGWSCPQGWMAGCLAKDNAQAKATARIEAAKLAKAQGKPQSDAAKLIQQTAYRPR
jgi:hypothetical protein